MSLDPHAVHLYTDGSSKKNPGGASGFAVVAEYPEELGRQPEVVCEGGFGESSNNRMELLACIEALVWTRQSKGWPNVTRIQIVTDSKYITENIQRARTWKRNGWRNRYGEPKENTDLWNKLLSERTKAGIRVDFVWSLGKKSPILKMVDKAAKFAADQGGLYPYDGFKPGRVSRSKIKGSATRFEAKGQLAMIRPYRKSLMKTGEYKIRFDRIAEDGSGYTQSFYCYASGALTFDLHSQHGYRVRFNSDPQYPQITSLIEEVALP